MVSSVVSPPDKAWAAPPVTLATFSAGIPTLLFTILSTSLSVFWRFPVPGRPDKLLIKSEIPSSLRVEVSSVSSVASSLVSPAISDSDAICQLLNSFGIGSPTESFTILPFWSRSYGGSCEGPILSMFIIYWVPGKGELTCSKVSTVPLI